ncbi:hypothetical protein Scep_024249 [Stephania cephalantha]|uniref:Uncharacterized protein n=1 Tax=Stephania cephalantha TaxID=152367 RepID=A0AAP0EWU9_9MAGN
MSYKCLSIHSRSVIAWVFSYSSFDTPSHAFSSEGEHRSWRSELWRCGGCGSATMLGRPRA